MPRTQYEAEETSRRINEALLLHTSSALGSLVYTVRRNVYGETHDEAMARAAPAANLGGICVGCRGRGPGQAGDGGCGVIVATGAAAERDDI